MISIHVFPVGILLNAAFMVFVFGFVEDNFGHFSLKLGDFVLWKYLLVFGTRVLTVLSVVWALVYMISQTTPYTTAKFLVGFGTGGVVFLIFLASAWLLGLTKWGKKDGVKKPLIVNLMLVLPFLLTLFLAFAVLVSILK